MYEYVRHGIVRLRVIDWHAVSKVYYEGVAVTARKSIHPCTRCGVTKMSTVEDADGAIERLRDGNTTKTLLVAWLPFIHVVDF